MANAYGNLNKEFYLERTFPDQHIDSVTFQYSLYGLCVGTAVLESSQGSSSKQLWSKSSNTNNGSGSGWSQATVQVWPGSESTIRFRYLNFWFACFMIVLF